MGSPAGRKIRYAHSIETACGARPKKSKIKKQFPSSRRRGEGRHPRPPVRTGAAFHPPELRLLRPRLADDRPEEPHRRPLSLSAAPRGQSLANDHQPVPVPTPPPAVPASRHRRGTRRKERRQSVVPIEGKELSCCSAAADTFDGCGLDSGSAKSIGKYGTTANIVQ